MSIFKQL